MTFRKLALSAAVAATLAAASIAPGWTDISTSACETELAQIEIPLEAAPPPEQCAPPASCVAEPYLPVPPGGYEIAGPGEAEEEETTVRLALPSGKSEKKKTLQKAAAKGMESDLSKLERLPLSRSQRLSRTALAYRGISYRWGGFSRLSGFDCSGLTRYLYLKEGIDLPHSAKLQYRMGKPVDAGYLKSGDLVFFDTNGPLSHVGMYIGDGRFIHAANPRRGVVVNRLSDPYYKKRYVGARRYMQS